MNTVAKQKGTSKTTTLLKTIGGAVLFLTVLLGYTNFFSHSTHSEIPTKTVSTVAINQSSQIDSTHSQSVFDATYTFQKTVAFATGGALSDPAKEGADVDFVQLLQSSLKAFYMFFRPLLWIAGLAMDNSLVFGEVFKLDKALWQFWQMARNFANFIIGFMFLRQVLKYIFDIKSGKSDTTNVTKIITKLLLSSVGVQMSWFIMGALIDLSIVLTAGLGGLPLNIVDQNVASKPIFGMKTSVKLNAKAAINDNLVAVYTWDGSALSASTAKYLLPCFTEKDEIKREEDFKNAYKISEKTDAGGGAGGGGSGKVLPLTVKKEDINRDYCIFGQDVLTKSKAPEGTKLVAGNENMQNIIIESRKEFVGAMNCKVTIGDDGYEKDVENIKKSPCSFLGNLTKKGMGKQGAFFSLYASILGLSSIQLDAPLTTAALTIETLIKMIIAVAFIIPIGILIVVLIIRVAYLRVIIAFSPLIALGIAGNIMPKNPLTDKFTLSSILSLILLPAVVTFAISLSIILLTSLTEGFSRKGSLETIGIHQRVVDGASCYDVGITTLCINSKAINFGAGITDYFTWIIMNIFGIGLMWFAVMAALKTSSLTKKTVESIEGMVSGIAGGAQIIPLPGGGYGSYGGITGAVKEITGKITNAPGQQVSKTANIIDGIGNNLLGKDRKLEGQISTATSITQNSETKMEDTFKTLDNIVKDESLFKDLNENITQIDGIKDYFNALNAKMGSSYKFESEKEVFNPKSAQGAKFLTNLVAHGDAYLGEGRGSQIINNMKFFYKTNGEIDKDIQDYLQKIIDNSKAEKTYKVDTNGKIQKIIKLEPEDGKEKSIELEATEKEKESLVGEYDEYIKNIKLADARSKQNAEAELTKWITKTFGNTTTRQDVENALRPAKANKPNNGAQKSAQSNPTSGSSTAQSSTNSGTPNGANPTPNP